MTAREAMLRNPLGPIAALATGGVALDRYAGIPWYLWAGFGLVGVVVWLIGQPRVSVAGLAVALAAAAALHHHAHRSVFPADDIGFLITEEPQLARLRGVLTDEPTFDPPAVGDPLRSVPEAARTRAVLEADMLLNGTVETPVSGLVSLTLVGPKPALRAGDAVEVTGWLHQPQGPNNPGERDFSSYLLDRRIRAVMLVRHIGDGVFHVRPVSGWSWDRLLARVRAWSRQQLDAQLPPAEAGVGGALLLGDGTALAREDWQKYIRTGVIHVLAVSGQHLAILAAFAWVVLRVLGVRRRPGAFAIALGLCFYSALAGGRPPVLRSAVMVTVACLGLFLRRPTSAASGFALAWLIVLFLNPADVADPGCQFSFLCVALLIWGISRWLGGRVRDPLADVIEAGRPAWQRWSRAAIKAIASSYFITIVLGMAVMPLTAARYQMISPVGILIGPPAVALASVALIAGFVELLASLAAPPLAGMVAIVTRWSLAGLTAVVDAADRLPHGHFYVGEVAPWWVLGFYLMLAVVLWGGFSARRQWCVAVGMAAWLVFGIGWTFIPARPDGLRVTFLAVGHGGATVIETPDGRTILVDVGTIAGPDITRRVVAPYLWRRGVRRIDEVFITHADLDHFNGLPALIERFAVGRVSLTPSFSTKPTPGVRVTLEAIAAAKIPIQIVKAGLRFSSGEVEFEVLHPPADGPPGPENARSLVLLIRHEGHSIALTGDLDLEGRSRVMQHPRVPIDVWMAPHHGGRTASPPELAAWVRPRLVVAHNATGEAKVSARVYESAGAAFVGTWPNGAITLISRADGLWLETFHSTGRQQIRAPGFLKRTP